MSDETQTPQPGELNWLAVRYISGELTDAESASFEQRLGRDEVACDAVSTAVRMAFAVRAVFESEPASQRNPAPDTRPRTAAQSPAKAARWISLSTAAVAVILVLSVANLLEPDSVRMSNIESERNRELAVLWTQSGDVLSGEGVVGESATTGTDDAFVAELAEDGLAPVDLVDVPEWLLVALETQRRQAGGENEILEN